MRTSNPILKDNMYKHTSPITTDGITKVMTLPGTLSKILFLLLCVASTALASVFILPQFMPQSMFYPMIIGSAILGLVLAIATAFKKEWSMVLAPMYALVEGVFIGLVSLFFEMMYPGLVLQAVTLTFGVLLSMLAIYQTGIIKVTEKFRMGVTAAIGGVMIIYLASIALNLFGMNMPYIHGSGIIGIGFSLFVVGLASLSLVLDFDMIDRGIESSAPKYMEWYCAFGIMVTLIWLYIEILKLLAKLRGND